MSIHTDSAQRLHVRHGATEVVVGQRSSTELFITLHDGGGESVETTSIQLRWDEALVIARHLQDLADKNVIARARAEVARQS